MKEIKPIAAYAALPPLPVLGVTAEKYAGPTGESNWVLLGRLLVGAYPAALDDKMNDNIVASILRLGINTFVCLQAEYQHRNVTEAQWRSGEKLRPYIYDAVRLLDEPWVFPDSATGGAAPPAGLNFVHFPIIDCDTVSDDKVLQLCNDLVQRLVKGENMYIHCW